MSGSKPSRERLNALRSQGLDAEGQPKTSYWKARIEAEEGRVLVAELTIELDALRTGGAPPAQAPPVATKAGKVVGLEKELATARGRITALEKELKTKATKTAKAAKASKAAKAARVSTGTDAERVDALEEELREAEEQKQRSQRNLMGRIREFQESNRDLQKDVRDALKSRDHWQDKARGLETVLEDLRGPKGEAAMGEAEAIAHYPTVQDLFDWFGVRVEEGRIIAVGEAQRNQIQLEIRKGKLARVVQLEGGKDRTYQTLALTEPANELLSILFPCRRYYEHRTDPRVIDASKLLGRRLPTT